jgi:iron-sulfur cluster insertion protein
MTERSTDFRVETTGDAGVRAATHGLTLSASAAARLRHLSEAKGTPLMLRVAVDGGGCSGFQYRFDLVGSADDDDIHIRNDDHTALVDPVSLPFLSGSVIDFVDDLAGAQFVIRNPNAASSCGCGVSFSI